MVQPLSCHVTGEVNSCINYNIYFIFSFHFLFYLTFVSFVLFCFFYFSFWDINASKQSQKNFRNTGWTAFPNRPFILTCLTISVLDTSPHFFTRFLNQTYIVLHKG